MLYVVVAWLIVLLLTVAVLCLLRTNDDRPRNGERPGTAELCAVATVFTAINAAFFVVIWFGGTGIVALLARLV